MPPSSNGSHGDDSHGDDANSEKPEVEDLNRTVPLSKGASSVPTPDATLPADIDLAATMLEDWKSALGDEVDPGQTIKMPSPESDGLDKTVRLSDDLDATRADPARTDSDDDMVIGVGYEVDQLLGEGGMGAVYAGRQQSMDRPVAIKVLKSKIEQMDGSQRAFTSEAIITGGLDHPNIVPIYDLGKQEDDALFYAMKQVEGVEWKDRIGTNSLSENLDILLRVADAVAFAHARCIIHRDLKPANIMLGSFGEVLVMDWGLAMPTHDHPRREVYHTPAPGGTPYYMAPEMLNGVEQVDRCSDVYLLGGILFEIITGKPPHTLDAPPETQREKVTACLVAVSQNVITATEKSGELLNIARKAMATDPVDRYQSVSEFQQAIRGYLSHEESIELAGRAAERLEAARNSGEYDEFSRARFGFETALEEWPENVRAIEGLKSTKYDYAKTALDRGDLDLGLSLLDGSDEDHSKLRNSIQAEIVKRDARQQQIRRLKRVSFGASLVVAIVA
ncbi:MAG: serine/threonine protein kinase, partial [Planctomycetes bacterium]|nr:serine/threonine protein kinase [Planctomycetota bacterium]